MWGAHLQPAGRRMPRCWLVARAEEHRLAAVELIRRREVVGGTGKQERWAVPSDGCHVPRPGFGWEMGKAGCWEVASHRAYLHLPDRQTGQRGPTAGFYQVPSAARDQAHLSEVLRKAQFLCRSHKPQRGCLTWGNREKAEITAELLLYSNQDGHP